MFKIDAIVNEAFYYKVPLERYTALQSRTEAIRNGLNILYTELGPDNEMLNIIYRDVIKLGEDLGCWEYNHGSDM